MGGCSHTVGTKKAFGYITEGHNLPSKLKEKCKMQSLDFRYFFNFKEC